MLPKKIVGDRRLLESILQYYLSERGLNELATYKLNPEDVEDFLGNLIHGKEPLSSHLSNNRLMLLRAAVLKVAHPALLVQNDTVTISSSVPDFWKKRLNDNKASIDSVVPSIGRIDLTDHPDGKLIAGTGWLVKKDVIITNSHVAAVFSKQNSRGEFKFLFNNSKSKSVGVDIDFLREYGSTKRQNFKILEILYFDKAAIPKVDIAFLKISNTSVADGTQNPRAPLILSKDSSLIPVDTEVAVIGYPTKDPNASTRYPLEVKQVFADIYDLKRLQPGQILTSNPSEPNLIQHNCSTLGGNSGSPVINLKTGEVVGLHFRGEFMKGGVALSSAAIQSEMTRLGI